MNYQVETPKGKRLFREDVENIILDVAGLIPVIGEPADALNAYLYAKKGEYLFAALSLISIIPEVGDAIGKGGKIATWAHKNFPRGASFVGKHGPKAAKNINELKALLHQNRDLVLGLGKIAKKNKWLAPYLPKMEEALRAFMDREYIPDDSLEK